MLIGVCCIVDLYAELLRVCNAQSMQILCTFDEVSQSHSRLNVVQIKRAIEIELFESLQGRCLLQSIDEAHRLLVRKIHSLKSQLFEIGQLFDVIMELLLSFSIHKQLWVAAEVELFKIFLVFQDVKNSARIFLHRLIQRLLIGSHDAVQADRSHL